MKRDNRGYEKILRDESHLAKFQRNMAEFDRRFCDMMMSGVDFDLQLIIHGNNGKLVHCRLKSDSFDRVPAEDKDSSRQK